MHTVRVFTHCTCLCNVCTCVGGFKSYCLVSPLIIHPPAMFFELSVDLKSSVQLVWLTSELKGFICLFIYPSPGIIRIWHCVWLLMWLLLWIRAHVVMFVWQAIYRLSHHLSPCIFSILAFYHVLAGKDIHTILQAFCNHWHASFSVQRGVGTECIGVKWFRGNHRYGKRQ